MHGLFCDRLEQMLASPAPVITPYDPGTDDPDDALLRLDLERSLESYVRDRRLLVERLRTLSPADWHKAAEHGEYSHYSVFIMFRHWPFTTSSTRIGSKSSCSIGTGQRSGGKHRRHDRDGRPNAAPSRTASDLINRLKMAAKKNCSLACLLRIHLQRGLKRRGHGQHRRVTTQ